MELTMYECAMISMSLHKYINSESCDENKEAIEEIKAIIRKLDNHLAEPTDQL